VKGNLIPVVGKDKQNINILMNMHSTPLEGNFCDERGKAVKPATIQDFNRQGICGQSDHMTSTYSISRWIWKWSMKLFFHLLGLTILNSFIILASCGSKL
jgi:hypothetical protein